MRIEIDGISMPICDPCGESILKGQLPSIWGCAECTRLQVTEAFEKAESGIELPRSRKRETKKKVKS